jgi:hypothetical protein
VLPNDRRLVVVEEVLPSDCTLEDVSSDKSFDDERVSLDPLDFNQAPRFISFGDIFLLRFALVIEDVLNSFIVLNSLQDEHLPVHLVVSFPQDWQTKEMEVEDFVEKFNFRPIFFKSKA